MTGLTCRNCTTWIRRHWQSTTLTAAWQRLHHTHPSSAAPACGRRACARARCGALHVTHYDACHPIQAVRIDVRVWKTSDQLDVTRVPKRHIAFGEGIHHCIGAPLVLYSKVAFEYLLKNIPDYEVIAYEHFHDPYQRGLKSLTVRF